MFTTNKHFILANWVPGVEDTHNDFNIIVFNNECFFNLPHHIRVNITPKCNKTKTSRKDSYFAPVLEVLESGHRGEPMLC